MILLDTHALLFWIMKPEKLGDQAARKLKKSARLGVHVITCFEIAILVEKQKIELPETVDDWIGDVLSHPKIEVIPLTVPVAIQCTQLPGGFHRDPVDRMLAAECLMNDYPLVTKDQQITDWGHIETIW